MLRKIFLIFSKLYTEVQMDIIRATNVKDILLAATERMSDYDIQDNPFTYDSKKTQTFYTP